MFKKLFYIIFIAAIVSCQSPSVSGDNFKSLQSVPGDLKQDWWIMSTKTKCKKVVYTEGSGKVSFHPTIIYKKFPGCLMLYNSISDLLLLDCRKTDVHGLFTYSTTRNKCNYNYAENKN